MSVMEQPKIEAGHRKLAEHLRERSLNLDGPFELSSGHESPYYLDAKLTGLDPEGITLAVEALVAETRDLDFDAIGGLEFGAAPIIGAFVLRSQQIDRPVAGFVVRKEKKAHGTRKQIEGPLPEKPCRVVIVDDVVTSGASIIRAIDAIQQKNHTVVRAFSIVDREEGAVERLQEKGIEYRPLVTASELGIAHYVNRGSGSTSTGEPL